jgi:hypothetical protein
MGVIFELKLNQKGGFTIVLTLMLLIELCESFIWRKFSSVGKGEWWDEMKYGQNLKIGGFPCHPKKYPRVTNVKAWGCSEAPLLHRQKSGHLSRHYIFIAFYSMHFSWSVFTVAFSFLLFYFAKINGWTPTYFFWRWCTPFFIAKNTLVFTRFVQWVFSFSSTAFSFCFLPWFLFRTSYFFVSRCIYTSSLWWFSSLKVDSKRLIGVEKEKKFHAYSGTNGSLFRLWLRLLHVMLDVIFIVCLVVFSIAWLVSNDWDCLMCLWKNHALFLLYGSILLWFSPLMLYLGWFGTCLHHVWL